MSWQSLLTTSILFYSINGLLHRTVMKTKHADPWAQAIVFQGLTGIFSLIITLFFGFRSPPSFLILNFLLMIILLTLASVFTFQAFQLIEASEVGILMSSQRLWTTIAAFIFLKETPTFSKILGTILILTGDGVVLWKKHQIKITKGVLFVLLAAFLYGISYVNAFKILKNFDAPSFQVYASLLPALTLLLIQPQTIKRMKFYSVPKNGLKVLVAAVLDTLASLSLYLAYQVGRNASQIAPLSATSVILTVILAAIFLKEKENLINKLVGTAIAFLGTILII